MLPDEERKLRESCLQLAHSASFAGGLGVNDILKNAQSYYDFVIGGDANTKPPLLHQAA